MLRIIFSLIAISSFYFTSAQVRPPAVGARERITSRSTTLAPARAVATLRVVDTIPKQMYQYYKIDQLRYRTYINAGLQDSVKLLKATNADWDDFDKAYNRLQQTFKNNPFNNIHDYVNSNSDYKSIGLVDRKFQTNTAKVCLRQLIFNINVSDLLLNKELTDKTDLKLLSMSIKNIDTLCLSYIVPFVTHNLYLLRYPKIIFKILDKAGTELRTAGCYLVTPKLCRDIACKTCSIFTTPCVTETVNNIIGLRDYVFDCANPSALTIAPGIYHLFIIDNGKIISYKSWSTDANDLMTGAGEAKTINIFLQ